MTGKRNIASLARAIRDELAKLPPEESSDRAGVSRSVTKTGEPVYVESLRLKNFRCFKKIEPRFDNQSSLDGRWTCIAGINGAGKSSILQALGAILFT